MGEDINFDPVVAKAVRENLTKSYEAARQLATSLESYAQTLQTCWQDECTNDVVELIRNGKLMYESSAEKIMQVINRLDEIERYLAQLTTAKKAAQMAAQDKMREQMKQYERNNDPMYPSYGNQTSIGPDRYR